MAEETHSTEGVSTPNPTPGSTEGTSTESSTTQVPGGYVPRAELERVQARERAFQSELDRIKAEQAAASSKPKSDDKGAEGSEAFDPDSFRRSLLRDVANVNALTMAAQNLKSEFPHADPALFGERLGDFASVDALRIAAEDSHRRVASVVETSLAEREKTLLKELAEKHGLKLEGEAGPQGTTQGSVAGDPTPDAYARMSFSEQMALEKAHPGIGDRILAKASSG